MAKQKYSCAHQSSTFNKLIQEKHNGEILKNGDLRIGNDMALSRQTHLIYKLK